MNDDRDDEMENEHGLGTAYLTNNIVHSPGESFDNGRAARYITPLPCACDRAYNYYL